MEKNLVIQLARLGDLLQTKRLILSLLRQGEVHLCIDQSLVDFASKIYPEAIVHGMQAHGVYSGTDVLQENRKTFKALCHEQYDGVYNCNFSGLNFAVASLFSPDSVHGYRTEHGQYTKDSWVKMAFRWTKARRSSPLNLMDFWGFMAKSPITPQEVNPIAMRKGGGIGVVLAGRNSRRSLPPEVLAQSVQSVFTGHRGAPVTLLGTRAEIPLARQLMRQFSGSLLSQVTDRVGQTNFSDLIEIVSNLDVVLTPDTGTMHLAAHLGTPLHAFFLSSAWTYETGPYGLGHRVWQSLQDCSPCVESRPCPHNTVCLEAFRSEKYQRFLAGKIDETYPENMLGLVSMLDAVGVTYMPVFGCDPKAQERLDARHLVAEYQGVLDIAPVHNNEIASRMYPEADWILEH